MSDQYEMPEKDRKEDIPNDYLDYLYDDLPSIPENNSSDDVHLLSDDLNLSEDLNDDDLKLSGSFSSGYVLERLEGKEMLEQENMTGGVGQCRF